MVAKFCPACGTPTSGAKFCSECGASTALAADYAPAAVPTGAVETSHVEQEVWRGQPDPVLSPLAARPRAMF